MSLQSDLEATGLVLLGGFSPNADQVLPELTGGARPKTIAMVGSVGPAMWDHLKAAPEFESDPHPVNAWSKRVLLELAKTHGAELVFPFDGPPYWPFQQWVMALPGTSQSPLGVVVHAKFGPWYALRGALLLDKQLEIAAPVEGPGPCPGCAEKPCLDACPSGALTRAHSFHAGVCRDYVRENANKDCAERGCLVRHACPFGRDYAYLPEQARHHMLAFAG
jgi:hypothetical protein